MKNNKERKLTAAEAQKMLFEKGKIITVRETEEMMKFMQTLSEIIVSEYLREQSKEMSSNPVRVGEKG
jgi:hypothetical protein